MKRTIAIAAAALVLSAGCTYNEIEPAKRTPSQLTEQEQHDQAVIDEYLDQSVYEDPGEPLWGWDG